MSKRVFVTCVFVSLYFFLCSTTYIVDGSGSMKGFARTGAIKRQIEDISENDARDSEDVRVLLFQSNIVSEVVITEVALSELNDTSLFSGKYTLLGKMADTVLTLPGDYVLLTDNVEDDNNTRGDGTKFYRTLMESQEISSVDVSPRISRFDGNPFRGDRQNYVGDSGMLVYFISVGSKASNTSRRNSLLNNLGTQGYTIFHLRPINSNHIGLTSLKNESSPFIVYSERGNYHLKIRPESKAFPVLQIDKQNRIKFSILMRSHYDYIGIRENTKVRIDNFSISHGGKPMMRDKPKISVSPSILPKSLEKGGAQKFDVEIILKPIKPSLTNRLQAMFNPKRCVLSFDMSLRTSENSIYMVEDAKNQYFTENMSDYSKIYSRPQDMISHFNPQNNRIVFHVQNEDDPADATTQIRLMYDNMGYFLLLISLAGILVAAVIFLYRLYQTPKSFFVSVETLPLGDVEDKELTRMGKLPLESCTVIRKLSGVVIKLNDTNRYYFKDSIFPSIDLPPKVLREVCEKDSNRKIRISMTKSRRKDA